MRRTLALSAMTDREVENKVCFMCGAIAGDFWETKPTRHALVRLYPRPGDATHFCVMCDECEEGLQSATLPKPDRIHLLAQIRRATIQDQEAVLDWLLQKFNLKTEKGRRD